MLVGWVRLANERTLSRRPKLGEKELSKREAIFKPIESEAVLDS